jgi:hypothetical protein
MQGGWNRKIEKGRRGKEKKIEERSLGGAGLSEAVMRITVVGEKSRRF